MCVMNLDCIRNGPGYNQQLDVRACMVCACALKTRKQCSAFKELQATVVVQAVDWIHTNKYRVHAFTARLLGITYEGEQDVIKVQSVRQEVNRTRVKPQADRKTGAVRGSVLTV